MRVATNSASEAMLTRIQLLSQRQSQLQTQASTGQKIFNPEDDPAAFGRVINWSTERSTLEQFKKNASKALDLSQATYAGLQELKKISDRAGELVTLGAGASSPDAFSAYGKEVNQLLEQAVQLGNRQFRSDYIFSGTDLKTAPISTTRVGGDIATVTYKGDLNQVSVQLSENSSIAPGTDSGTNQGIAAFIDNLRQLRDALASGSSSNVSNVQQSLTDGENMLVGALSQQGAVQMRIEVSQSEQANRSQNIDKLISDSTDADLSKTVVQLNQASTAYQAALASGTKILQMSILDYIH